MIESLKAFAANSTTVYAGAGAIGVGLAWVLKKIPNKTIKAKVGRWMFGLGVTVTLGLAKWKWTKGVWNKVVEPYCIDLIDNVVVTGLGKFIEGMRSDNG